MKTTPVQVETTEGISIVTMDNPPVNALSHALRRVLQKTIQAVAQDDGVDAIVLMGKGKNFCAGADIREFDEPSTDSLLTEVITVIENLNKAVVAAIHGAALGGGLELALGCHYRIADKSAKLGLPEVNIGIIPGAGGTQRLPRLTGVEQATEMVTSGRPVDAAKALRLGLIDAIADSDLKSFAIQFAKEHAAKPLTRLSEVTTHPPATEDYFKKQRDQLLEKFRGQQSPVNALDAIRGAVKLPFEDGLKQERKIFSKLRNSDQARALRHVFFAERAVSKPPEYTNIKPRNIESVAVIGGGTMGAGITAAFLKAGLPVCIIECNANTVSRSRSNVEKNLQGFVARGRLREEDKYNLMRKLCASTQYKNIADADLVIEAVFEDMDVKKNVFTRLDNVVKPGAILATNTSYLDINEIARMTSRTHDVIGLHFFSPAHVMRLLEIIKTDETANDVIASGFGVARLLGKTGVLCGVCEGFIGNRILANTRKQAEYMLEDGALPWEIDKAMEAFGMAMGPFKVNDLSGLDIGWAMRKRLASTRDPNERYVTIADQLCEQGWFGRKSGRGWYIYDSNKQPTPNPGAKSIILVESAKHGIQRRHFSTEEIQKRLVLAMINEASHILDEGIAQRPLDIDIVKIHGYGFPRWRGGPMHYADCTGLEKVFTEIEGLSREDNYFWKPSPLLGRLVQQGRSFSDLNDRKQVLS